MVSKYLDLKFMLLGLGFILAASPLSVREYGLSLAAVVIGLFFVIIGFAYKQDPKDGR
jgi:hypothetical protein